MNRILSASTLVVAAFLTLPVAGQAPPSKPLTVTDLNRQGGLTGKAPDDLTWSPDGARVTYVAEDDSLMQVEAETGKVSVLVGHSKLASLINSNTPEKDKDHRARYNMAGYIWAPDSRHLLFDSNGQLWLYDLHNGTGLDLASSGSGSGDDPKFAPDGTGVSFVRDHNLYLCQLHKPGSPSVALTNNKEPNILNGEVDWLYLEELETRSNYFWSPDSREIAYLQMNEIGVSQYPLVDWIPTHASVDMQLYPQPAGNNPVVRVGVVSAGGGKTEWIKLPAEESQAYVPRFGWVNHKTLWIETISRDQKHRNLYFADASTGNATLALAMNDDKFFDADYDVNFSESRFALTSWQDGHAHVYLYSFDSGNPGTAKLDRQLTKGDFEVTSIVGMSEKGQALYYISNEGDARQRQLWMIKTDGSGKRKMTESDGWHDITASENTGFYADKHSDLTTPTAVSMCRFGGACKSFWQSKPIKDYALTKPVELELKASDGTTLYAELWLPAKTAKASIPLIVSPYGGPHAQAVRDAWSAGNLFNELLAQHGYAVLEVDNRGMGGRGRDFAQAAYMNFGKVQLEDQLHALDDVLSRYPQLDANRLGWWGWSWGGTFTLNAMTNSPRFIAGVAVAPVTDWRNYDTAYTERYLGTPASNPDGYRDFSVINGAQNLKGHLLLVHGTGDDNVHMANTIQFIQRLIAADIPYDLQLYPRKTHSISGEEARTHLFGRIVSHFDQYLMKPHPNVTDTDTHSGAAQ